MENSISQNLHLFEESENRDKQVQRTKMTATFVTKLDNCS